VLHRPSRSPWTRTRTRRRPGAIGYLLAPASVKSSSGALTAPFHAAGRSRRRRSRGPLRCCFRRSSGNGASNTGEVPCVCGGGAGWRACRCWRGAVSVRYPTTEEGSCPSRCLISASPATTSRARSCRAISTATSSTARRSRRSTSTASATSFGWPRGSGARAGRTSSWASAASTAATRTQSRLLPQLGPRLCVLLALPRPDRPHRRRAGSDGGLKSLDFTLRRRRARTARRARARRLARLR
jgi:hypothetical protein